MAVVADLGISIDGFTPAREIAEQAQAAEAGGAKTLWIATHLFLRDPVSLAAAALAATRTLRVALMAISPYAMHPVHAAMAAATLDEMHPGRVILSLGAGAPADLAAAGIERPRPLATLREAIDICRALFAGEAVNFEGQAFRVAGRRLVGAPCAVPIMLAASGPKMLELAGARADGVVISGATSAPFVRWSLDAAERGRGKRPLRRCGIVYARIGDDARAAGNAIRRTLGFILRGEHHGANVRMGGAVLDQAALRDAYAAEDWARVDRLIDDRVVASHAACGDADQMRARLDMYRGAGLDEIILNGIAEPDAILATLEAVGTRK